MEEELSSKDNIENASDLSATSDATTIPVTSNNNQSLVSSNPSIADRTAMEETTNDETYVLIVKKEGDELHTMNSQNNRVYPGGTD